jgi:hypothetical protein
VGQISLQINSLEVDPTIQTFCERPLDLNFPNGVLRVEFWVRQGDREMLLVMDDACEARSTLIEGVELAVCAIPAPAERSPARPALPMRKPWPPVWCIAARFAAEQASIQPEGAHRHNAVAV